MSTLPHIDSRPLYVPSALKLWMDQIARAGRTFSYADGAPKGLIIGKKATFIIATGSFYDAQTRMASFNFVEPYLRSLFGFLGVTDATFLTAGGTKALNQPPRENPLALQFVGASALSPPLHVGVENNSSTMLITRLETGESR